MPVCVESGELKIHELVNATFLFVVGAAKNSGKRTIPTINNDGTSISPHEDLSCPAERFNQRATDVS